jgi:hypothetical protein
MGKRKVEGPTELDGVTHFDPDAPTKRPEGTKQLKGEGIAKWEAGIEVRGMFRGIRGITTAFGDSELVDIEFAGGRRVTFGCPVILGQRLRQVAPGVEVIIRCMGKRPTANGQTAWHYEVFTPGVDDEEMNF